MALLALIAGGNSLDRWFPEFEELHMAKLAEDEQAGKDTPITSSEYRETKAMYLMHRVMDAEESAMLTNMQAAEYNPITGGRRLTRWGSSINFANLRGIVGWGNVVDSKGDQVAFEGRRDNDDKITGATVADLSRLPSNVLLESSIRIDELRAVPNSVF